MSAASQLGRVIESPAIAGPRQRRGKSLMRRKYQKGYVYQRSHGKVWDPKASAYVQF